MSAIIDIVNDSEELSNYGKEQIKKDLHNEMVEYKKPNVLSIKGKFNFSSVEQDMINYTFYNFNKIEIDKFNNYVLKLETNEIIKFFNYEKNAQIYDYIKNIYKSIRDKSIWLTSTTDTEKEIIEDSGTFTFFNEVRTHTRKDKKNNNEITKGTIKLYINNSAYKLFELGLKKYYTTYNFFITFNIKGKYAKRLYDIFYAYIYKNDNESEKNKEKLKEKFEYHISYNNFIELLQLPYKKIQDIKNRVIIPALKELNNNSKCNIDIEYFIDKKNKMIVFLYSRANIMKYNMLINEQAQKLYNKVNEKVEEEQQLIDEYTLFDFLKGNELIPMEEEKKESKNNET